MRTALVTGATRGIGKATAIGLAKLGYLVILGYKNNEQMAEEVVNSIRKNGGTAHAIQVDISDNVSIENMVDTICSKYEGVDILVNNAGISLQKLLIDTSYDEWTEVIDTNLNSAFYITKLLLPYMLSNKWGRIINISSIWGLVGGSMEVAYSTSKAGLIGFTKALAKEYGPSNILVNCVAPGLIATDMNNNLTEEETAQVCEDIALGRAGTPLEVAELVCFLANEKTSYITGQVIQIDGLMKG